MITIITINPHYHTLIIIMLLPSWVKGLAGRPDRHSDANVSHTMLWPKIKTSVKSLFSNFILDLDSLPFLTSLLSWSSSWYCCQAGQRALLGDTTATVMLMCLLQSFWPKIDIWPGTWVKSLLFWIWIACLCLWYIRKGIFVSPSTKIDLW